MATLLLLGPLLLFAGTTRAQEPPPQNVPDWVREIRLGVTASAGSGVTSGGLRVSGFVTRGAGNVKDEPDWERTSFSQASRPDEDRMQLTWQLAL